MKPLVEARNTCARCGRPNTVYAKGDTCRECRGIGVQQKTSFLQTSEDLIGWGDVMCRRSDGTYYIGGLKRHSH